MAPKTQNTEGENAALKSQQQDFQNFLVTHLEQQHQQFLLQMEEQRKVDKESAQERSEKTIIDDFAKIKISSALQRKISEFEDRCYTASGAFRINLPEDLLIEILSTLPPKSLARFKCVSRTMCRLISNALPMKSVPKLLIFSGSEDKSLSFHSLDNKTRIERLFSPLDEDVAQHDTFKVHSSCHGLLLTQIDNDLFVWNPLTNFFGKVLTLNIGSSCYCENYFVISLCYCSTNAKYKVVLVEKKWTYSWSSQDFYVATFGSKSWEKIKDVHLDNVFEGPLIKGFRYWLDRCDSLTYHRSIRSESCILFFDPNTNKFTKVASPQPKEDNISDTFLGIGVIDECLCITRWDDPGNYKGNIEFLVMKEYGNEISWEILFVISNTPEFRSHGGMEPLFRTKEGEILMNMKMYGTGASFKCYDDNGNYLRDVLVPAYDESSELLLYEESLFSPTV